MSLLGLTFACTLIGKDKKQTPQVIIVSATPAMGATVPYVTPTPWIVPTPTLPPREAMTDAQNALRNGDYVNAVLLYQSVLGAGDSDAIMRAAAAYEMGEAALREGLYDQAAAALSDFISGYPGDTRIPQAHFLRGDAYLGLSEWDAAIDDFQTYLSLRPGIIDSYAYERMGDAYLALGMAQQSLDSYARAADSTRALESLLALRERVAATYVSAGQPAEAVKQYDAILADAQNGPYRASIQYQAAQLLLSMGDSSGAYGRLQGIVTDYPDTYAAYQAMALLDQANWKLDTLLRGQIYYYNEDWTAAIQEFNAYTSETGQAPIDMLLMLGRAYRAAGNPQAAVTTFQTILDYYPTDPAFGDAWLEQGRTYFLSGDTTAAIQRYIELATLHPDVAQGAEALWRAGYLYSTIGDTANALSTFDTLGQLYPGTEWAQEGLMLGATLAYSSGNTGQATQLFSRLASTGYGENQAAAYLWVGRLYQSEGKDDLARQAYQQAAAADPGGYYSLRADDLLNGRAPFQAPAADNFTFDEASELSEAETWLRTTFGITQDGALYPLSATLQADPRLIRGQELMAVAAYDEAEQELESLRQAISGDALGTYQLAIYFRDRGLYRLSITAAADLITKAGINTTQAPGLIARLRFPAYYSDLVLPHAEQYNLDPLLVFSLIRQESLFEGYATSYAAAQGLMQIIPDTGQWIATQLDWPNYQNNDVYRPYINVAFGTYYLSWVMQQVDNLPYVALAGYNGGPGNAAQWLGISGPDIDLFVQTIGYDETQTYVRRIYEQYSVYRELYGTSSG